MIQHSLRSKALRNVGISYDEGSQRFESFFRVVDVSDRSFKGADICALTVHQSMHISFELMGDPVLRQKF